MIRLHYWKRIAVSAAIFFLMAGCGMLPSPQETIKAPLPPQVEQTATDQRPNIQAVLPKGAKLLTPAHPQGAEEILFGDIDGDGSDEALVIYEENLPNQRVLWAALLKEIEGEWQIDWRTQGPGYEIDYANLADITGDGQLEILLGWTFGASVGNGLDIYRWTATSPELLVQTGYHRLDVENMPSSSDQNGQSEIAIWTKDTGLAYQVEVYRWSEAEKDLLPAEDVYPYYFKKVGTYYTEQTTQQPEQAILWYYLADAQLKSGLVNEALQSIEKGLALEDIYPSKEQFEQLKKLAKESVEYVSLQMVIGRTQEEVKELLGNNYLEVESALDGKMMWRYDFAQKEGYTFDEKELDNVDLEGLLDGSLKLQLFVSWTEEGTAHGYTLYYRQDGNVQEERLFPDGGLRKTTIFP